MRRAPLAWPSVRPHTWTRGRKAPALQLFINGRVRAGNVGVRVPLGVCVCVVVCVGGEGRCMKHEKIIARPSELA